jgi:hypothetical protein
MKATVITVYDNDGKEIKNVSTEIVLNGETYVKREMDNPLPSTPAKPIWETCRETMWYYNPYKWIGTSDEEGTSQQDSSLCKLNKHLNALAYLSEVARRCNGDRVVEWANNKQDKFTVQRWDNNLSKFVRCAIFQQIAFLDIEARDHSFEVDLHIWNDYYGLPNE